MTLPNFLIVGAAKAGTTSLYHYLRQHPDVFMSPVKEAQYFARDEREVGRTPPRSQESYRRLFAGVHSERAIGEASPQYLPSPTAAAQIARDLPQARIIATLRHPVERAYSSYLGRLRAASERRSPERALDADGYYVRTSLYAENLQRYCSLFPPARIKVILFEDLCAEPQRLMRELFDFLEIDPGFLPDLSTRHNPAQVPRSRLLNRLLLGAARCAHATLPTALSGTGLAAWAQRPLLRAPPVLPEALRRKMLEYFRDDTRVTARLIGRDLSRWLR